MKFPQIEDIAVTSVAHVEISCSVADALSVMLKQQHRSLIVIDHDCFRILSIVDILHMQKDVPNLDIPLCELNLSMVPTIDKNKNILDTLEYLNNSIEHICVLNPDKTLYGMITHTDITNNIDPDTLIENYKLTDFLKLGRRMKWVKKDTIISDLFDGMSNGSFENVIIVEDMKPIGILTTKDLIKLIKNNSDMNLAVSDLMSSPVDTIHKESSIKDALVFIKKKSYKRVVIVDDDGKLAGAITQKELISLTYSNWAIMMKEHQTELKEINHILKNQNKEFETIASTDPLTGLYNRYKFSKLYDLEYQTMLQRANSMSIILLDIDHFKQINDTYGHSVGDQVIIKIAHSILGALRNTDIICRWGGEEFVALLPATTLDQTSLLAEKLRNHIEMDIAENITASFGVARVTENDKMKDAISRADKALYLAKNSGRNCIRTELDC